MRVVIMGCGRTGAELATQLDRRGHEVIVLDLAQSAFRRFLRHDFKGKARVGNGIDQDVQRRIGVASADVFVAVTQGDNRNAMAAQIARHIFGVAHVVCRIKDPSRAEFYRDLGIDTFCPAVISTELLLGSLLGERV